jgi:hypothetical protein
LRVRNWAIQGTLVVVVIGEIAVLLVETLDRVIDLVDLVFRKVVITLVKETKIEVVLDTLDKGMVVECPLEVEV